MIKLNSFICGDCMDYLPQFPDKYFNLAIVDPPYGIDINKSGRLKKYNDTKKHGMTTYRNKTILMSCFA